MKKYHLMICAILLFCSTNCLAESLSTLEGLVLCKEDDSALALVQKIEKGDGFEKSGRDFRKPKTTINAFGYQVVYLGAKGVDMVPGANITVKGKYEDVAKAVKSVYKGKFRCDQEGCVSQVNQYNHVMVYAHPEDQKLTIIQCGYFGP
jgi:hypothetical protein